MNSKISSLFCLLLIFNLGITSEAATFSDDFSNGINPLYWHAYTTGPRWSVTATNQSVLIASSLGTANGFDGGGLQSTLTLSGNFDVSVDFTNANLTWLTGGPGNQAQLNCFFGDFASPSNFFVVRSDESGVNQNVHVWVGNFGGHFLAPAIATSASFGTLRVTRTNSLLTGYFNSTVVAQTNNYLTNPARINLVLQNNGTHDAISIAYRNVSVAADKILVGPPLTIVRPSSNQIALSWPTWGVAWTTNYVLQSATTLSDTNGWTRIATIPMTNGDSCTITDFLGTGTRFYRLEQP